jgi:hypothetical protein
LKWEISDWLDAKLGDRGHARLLLHRIHGGVPSHWARVIAWLTPAADQFEKTGRNAAGITVVRALSLTMRSR